MTFLAEGDLCGAQAWAEQKLDLTPGVMSYAESAVQLACAHVLLALGEIQPSIALLRTLETTAVKHGWGHRLNEIHVCLSIALQRKGERNTAAEVLGYVLQRALPQGYVRLFLNGGFPLAEVLAEIVRQDGAGAVHARHLLHLFNEELPSDEQPASVAPLRLTLSVKKMLHRQTSSTGWWNR